MQRQLVPHSGTLIADARSKIAAVLLTLAVVACGGPADRPEVREVSGNAAHIVGAAPQADTEGQTEDEFQVDAISEAKATHQPSPGNQPTACEHGTVVECKVWLNDVDCFTGLAVCDNGELSGCMDANAAEAQLGLLDETAG